MAVFARRDEVQGFAKNESIAWPWESDKQAAWNEFERMWNLIGITSTKEGSCNMACYKAQVFPKKKAVPALPAVAEPERGSPHLKYMSYCEGQVFPHRISCATAPFV
eukprot:COSAG06_NODE_4140_length_4533_cov_3.136446_5_plen_107_part_00